MRRLIVMMGWRLLIAMFFNGCSNGVVNVPQKCKIPHTEEPKIDNSACKDNDNSCIISKILKNYESQKDYGKRLKINSEICR